MGSASNYGAQMLSHDFIKRIARELVFNVGGHRVYGMTLSNGILLTSQHRCARTMCYGTLRRHCLVWGYGEMVVKRVKERKERRRREEVGGGWVPFYTPRNMRTFPKWTVTLHLPYQCHMYTSLLPNPYTDICLHGVLWHLGRSPGASVVLT